MDWQERLSGLPRWALPAVGGAGAALVYWLRKKRQPITPITAPVASVQQDLPADSLPAYNGGSTDYGNLPMPVNFQPVLDMLGQLGTAITGQNSAFGAALGSLQASEAAGFEQLAGALSARSPVTAPAQPAQPVPPVPYLPPVPAPVAPAPVAPAPAPASPPSTNPGADWAALAYYLGAKSWHPTGLHFAGEPVQIRWKEAPYNAEEPGPPSGNYPVAYLPVNYNGDHDFNRFAWGVVPMAESTFIHTLRWVADYMSGHPGADTRTVWDGMLGRLMRDIGPYGDGRTWYNTGFDLGSVRNSPYLTGESTGVDNPAWQNIY
jgi:hypothetical protein